MLGYVYILTNPGMQGLVKIGSSKDDVKGQVAILSGQTGVPSKFVCQHCYEVSSTSDKAHEVFERKAHEDFSPYRQGGDRGFFRLKHEHARLLLEGLAKMLEKDNTWQIRKVRVGKDGTILDKGRTTPPSDGQPERRPPLTFRMVKIRKGSKLIFTRDRTQTAIVVSEKEVDYKGKKYALSSVTKMLLNHPRSVRGSDYWEYQRETLTERRNRMEGKTTEKRTKFRRRRTAPSSGRAKPRPPFRFSMVGIPIESTLTFSKDGSKVAKVVSDKEIEYRGRRGALSPITLEILQQEYGSKGIGVQGAAYWEFEGETLAARRDRLEGRSIE